jgi:O-succinylbenzoic acid--CoA ligase
VPTQLVRRLDDPVLREYDAVLVGGGPLGPEVRRVAEQRGINVVHTYGMSETCGGCVYDGVPLDGVAVKLSAEGEVLIGGPVLFDGYDGDPELTASVLHEGWLHTFDLGRFDHDGRLEIIGRTDDVIISGGVNVPPQAVETMLRRHPGVREVAIVGPADSEWGQRVVALVVGDATLEELRDLVEPRAWAPRQLVRIERIPLLGNGKVDRAALKELTDV